jgi:hypothetical protein
MRRGFHLPRPAHKGVSDYMVEMPVRIDQPHGVQPVLLNVRLQDGTLFRRTAGGVDDDALTRCIGYDICIYFVWIKYQAVYLHFAMFYENSRQMFGLPAASIDFQFNYQSSIFN